MWKESLGWAVLCALPFLLNDYSLNNFAFFLVGVPMALGLAFMWGKGGILAFSQSAFYGLGAYVYAICVVNWGNVNLAGVGGVLLALGVTGVVALVLGYFMFYGGITGVFVGIVTLCITLMMQLFMNQTAGPQWHIGEARLNGFNGIGDIDGPMLQLGGWSLKMEGLTLYIFVVLVCAGVFYGLRHLTRTKWGLSVVGVKENPVRAASLGYDVRRIRLMAFVIGTMCASVSGILYVSWGNYVTPETMGLIAAATPVIWVCVGGREKLSAVFIATVGLAWLSQWLTIYGAQYAIVVLGLIFVVAMALMPRGCIVTLMDLIQRWLPGRTRYHRAVGDQHRP